MHTVRKGVKGARARTRVKRTWRSVLRAAVVSLRHSRAQPGDAPEALAVEADVLVG